VQCFYFLVLTYTLTITDIQCVWLTVKYYFFCERAIHIMQKGEKGS